ncbi:hypothetical protein [Mycetocola zhujimingii]|uniref:hypothetical protein n=1 Tax=Mycetocola zhujimingii TaxID=2079792 RepID=UPI000D3C71F7|nr:hypothetical protein [Mycetocola zhujimingii]AWB86842.1 hypothetical protein C3E77_09570 [Mycetocola zhujimingii]
MVAQLLRLRLQFLGNLFRQSPRRVIGAVVIAAAGFALLYLFGATLAALRSAPDELTRNTLVLLGSFVILGFILIPLIFGVEDDLDPRSFALFGVRDRSLSTGLLVAALVSVPSLILVLIVLVLSLTTAVSGSRGFLPVMLALLSAVLAVATCVIAARIATAAASLLLASRRSKELTGLIGIAVLVLLAPAVILLSSVNWGRDGAAVLGSAADVISWTPFGAVWSFPGDVAIGDGGAAILKFLIAAATVAGLWFVWDRLVAYMLVNPGRDVVTTSSAGMGWFDLMPARPGAAVAARSMTYWARDPRYLMSVVIIPIVPFVMMVPFLVVGVPIEPLALLPLPVMAIFLGWSVHNDLAFDSTAVWLHFASGVRGYADRLGRLFPVALIGVPLVVVGSMISIQFYGDWVVLPSMIGVSSALFLGGLGLSSFISARFPYPVALPGDSPFQQPQSSGASGGVSQAAGLLASVLVATPAGVLAWLGFTDDASWHVLALWAGVGLGVFTLVLGVWAGGRVFDRRGPEIVAFAVSH